MITHASKPQSEGAKPTSPREPSLAWLDVVREQVASLKFGTVQITVHESRVVQVERHEKLRIDHNG